MNTSLLPPTALFDPAGSAKISRGTLGYIRTRVQQWAYNLLITEFKKSGISQADLGRRLDKTADVISRMLSRPANWELDTFSAVIFALTGGLLTFDVRYPAKQDVVPLVPQIQAAQMPRTDKAAQQDSPNLDFIKPFFSVAA
jgi:hypothetical protein